MRKKELFFINDPDLNSSTFIILNIYIYIINELFELTIMTSYKPFSGAKSATGDSAEAIILHFT